MGKAKRAHVVIAASLALGGGATDALRHRRVGTARSAPLPTLQLTARLPVGASYRFFFFLFFFPKIAFQFSL